MRAVASKYLDIFHLSRLRHDPDETVRSMVVLRLPQRQLLEMRNDPDREVRIRVAIETAAARLAADDARR